MHDAPAAGEGVRRAASRRRNDHAVGHGFGEEAPTDEDFDDGEVGVSAAVDYYFVHCEDVGG